MEYRGGDGKDRGEKGGEHAEQLSLQASARTGPRSLSRDDVLGFKEQLVKNYQPRSVNSMLAALNGLYSREEALALLYRWSGDGGGEALEKQAYLP